MYIPPKNDIEYSRSRLDAIMRRRRLSFNPYTVSDSRLLEIAHTTGWGNDYDLTQIVVIRFTRLAPIDYTKRYGGIYMTIGNSGEEIYLPGWEIASPGPAIDSGRIERFMLGKRILYNDRDIEWLVGKKVFVSHAIRVGSISGAVRLAYRMHRLCGNPGKDAATLLKALSYTHMTLTTTSRV